MDRTVLVMLTTGVVTTITKFRRNTSAFYKLEWEQCLLCTSQHPTATPPNHTTPYLTIPHHTTPHHTTLPLHHTIPHLTSPHHTPMPPHQPTSPPVHQSTSRVWWGVGWPTSSFPHSQTSSQIWLTSCPVMELMALNNASCSPFMVYVYTQVRNKNGLLHHSHNIVLVIKAAQCRSSPQLPALHCPCIDCCCVQGGAKDWVNTAWPVRVLDTTIFKHYKSSMLLVVVYATKLSQQCQQGSSSYSKLF